MIFVIIAFLLYLIIQQYRKKNWGVGIFVVALYLFSAICTIFYISEYRLQNEVTFFPGLLFVFTMLFFFTPFFMKRPVIESPVDNEFIRRFCVVGYVAGSALALCTLLVIPGISFISVSGFSEVRSSLYASDIQVFKNGSLQGYAHMFLYYFSPLCFSMLLMFFYAFCYVEKHTFLKIILFIASLSGTAVGMLSAGRTQIIYWILFFLYCFILFAHSFKKSQKHGMILLSVIFFALVGFYIFTVTVSRFGDTYEGTNASLISYSGQSLQLFCDFVNNFHGHNYTLGRIFPLSRFLLMGEFSLSAYRDQVMASSGRDIGIFYTFLGDLFVDVGILGMLLYAFVYNRVAKLFVCKVSCDLSSLLIISVIVLIPMQGLFYYSFWRWQVSLSVIFTIIISKYLSPNEFNR